MLCPIIFEKKTKQRTLFKICETQKRVKRCCGRICIENGLACLEQHCYLAGEIQILSFCRHTVRQPSCPLEYRLSRGPIHRPPARSFLFFFLHFLICMMLSESLFVSSARFRIGNLVLPGRPLLFIGRGNNNISAYFVGFELPSPPFPLPPPPPTIPSADVSTQLNDTGDPRSRFHLPRGRTEKHCRLYLTHVCVQ